MHSPSPFRPQGLRPRPWTPFHAAACEAIHRALTERGEDLTRSGLHADMLDLRPRIVRIVDNSSSMALKRAVCHEVREHGFMGGGWGARWPTPGLERPETVPKMPAELLGPPPPPRPASTPATPPVDKPLGQR